MTITGICSKCGQSIEFDETMAGTTIECPHCQRLTPAVIPRPELAHTAAKSVTHARQSRVGLAGLILLLVVGFGLILNGCASQSQNGINQVYCAVQYCTGWLLLAAALILEVLRQIARKL